jgi:hypothetical protein
VNDIGLPVTDQLGDLAKAAEIPKGRDMPNHVRHFKAGDATIGLRARQ